MLALKSNTENKSGSISKSRSQLFFAPAGDAAKTIKPKDTQEKPNAPAKKRAWDIFHIRNWSNAKSSSVKNTLNVVADPSTANETKVSSEVKSHWGQFVVLDPLDFFTQTNFNRNYSPLLATACQTGVNDEESKQQPDI